MNRYLIQHLFLFLLMGSMILPMRGQDTLTNNYYLLKSFPFTNILLAQGEILLDNNSRFNFLYHTFHVDHWSSGTWTMNDGLLLLSSDFENFQNVDLTVQETNDSQTKQIKVLIQNPHDPEWRFMYVTFNDGSLRYEISPYGDTCLFEGTPILKSLRVYFADGNSKTYYIKNRDSNTFIISLNIPANYLNYVPFQEEKVLFYEDSLKIRNDVFLKRKKN